MRPEDQALLREKVTITGDGNVVGRDNTTFVATQAADEYGVPK